MKEFKEQNVYDDEYADELGQNDEIEPEEEGFMKGYNESTDPSKCANCKKMLKDEDFIEEEIKGETYRFCSEKCADAFEIKS